MTIHAGPYIDRTIRMRMHWAAKYRDEARALEAKAAELRDAADQAEAEAARLGKDTDFDFQPFLSK